MAAVVAADAAAAAVAATAGYRCFVMAPKTVGITMAE